MDAKKPFLEPQCLFENTYKEQIQRILKKRMSIRAVLMDSPKNKNDNAIKI